jgi:hypothetical protein
MGLIFALFGNPQDHLFFLREFYGVADEIGEALP